MADIEEGLRELERGEGKWYTSEELDELCGVKRRTPSVRRRRQSNRKRRTL